MRKFIRGYAQEMTLQRLLLYTFIGAVIAIFLVTVPTTYTLLAAAGIVVLGAAWLRPEFGILLIVVLTSSIVFEKKLPLIPIGVGSFSIPDVLLLFMLGCLAYRYVMEEDFSLSPNPLNTPLLLFIVFSLVSAVLSVTLYGVDFNDVARMFRSISYYMIFFLITNLVTEERQVRILIKGLLVIAAVVSIAMVAQAIIGESIQLMPGRIETADALEKEFGTLRILPPGQTLVFVTAITTICALVLVREKPVLFSGTFMLAILLGTGIILTYNRNYWVALILAVLILLMITATEYRIRLAILLTAILISGGAVVAIYSGTEGKIGTTVNAVSERFGSIFAGKALLRSSSIEYRGIENEYAMTQIIKHPLAGIGLGNDYRPKIYGKNDKLTYYVHNAYLWILTDMGVIGFLLFFWFYVLFLYRAAKRWKGIEDDFMKSSVVGFMLSGLGTLFLAFVNPVFMQPFSIVIIAILIGLTESIFKLNETWHAEIQEGFVPPHG